MTKKRSLIPPAHEHTSLFCATEHQSVSGHKLWMSPPTWSVAQDQQSWSHGSHAKRASPITAVTSMRAQTHPGDGFISYFLHCQIAELVAPRTAAGEEGKVSLEPVDPLAQAHVLTASHETGTTEIISEQTGMWDFP